MDSGTQQVIRNIFPIPFIDSNFIHLGHPLILPAKDRSSAYNFVIDKFKAKLPAYKANKLSHAGRLTLINSVFASIPIYYMSNILFPKKFLAKLTAIIRNFWWTGVRDDASAKSLCLRAWKDICTPKNEGGLGIKNMQATNRSLILAAAWRIAENPNSHLSRIIQSKYFPHSSLWRANQNVPKSAFWASINKIRPVLVRNSFFQIRAGNISLWSSPWFTSWEMIYDHLIIQASDFVYPALVKNLWLPSQKKWNTNLIDTLFDTDIANTIKQVPIIQEEDEDLLCWRPTPTGKLSAYKTCLQAMQEEG